MKKGFTLIELLAVIVILAIIALIATPIILGIINDARKESNERSAELYASAVRNAIASYQLTNPKAPESFEDLTIEHDGEVVCETEELYADGSFYIADCTVNGDEVDYTYGEPQEQQITRYYSWAREGYIGEELPSSAKTTLSEIDTYGYLFYLVFDVDTNNKVTAAYTCFIKNDVEYCLKGGDNGASYESNKTVLEDAFKDVENACSFDEESSSCWNDASMLSVNVYSNGDVNPSQVDGGCRIYENGSFGCAYSGMPEE